MLNIFRLYTNSTISNANKLVRSIVAETVFFLRFLRIVFDNDFKYKTINFHKQRKPPAKYQDLGILQNLLEMAKPYSVKTLGRKNIARKIE